MRIALFNSADTKGSRAGFGCPTGHHVSHGHRYLTPSPEGSCAALGCRRGYIAETSGAAPADEELTTCTQQTVMNMVLK
jgi:hypothetical protein